MDSLGPLNFQAHAGRVAQAYGARAPARTGSPTAAPQAGQGSTGPGSTGPGSIGPNGIIQPPFPPTRDPNGRGSAPQARQDRLTLSPAAPKIPEQIEQLVAGQVDSPVSRGQGFDEPNPRSASARQPGASGAYAMYTRSADRVEVATSLAVGRSIDARG
jgi:hypothetical protein